MRAQSSPRSKDDPVVGRDVEAEHSRALPCVAIRGKRRAGKESRSLA
jgi:hypothetical protein